MSNGLIRPLPVPDIGRLLGQAGRTYFDIREAERRAALGEKEEEQFSLIKDLREGAFTDPSKLAQLAVLDPDRALKVQQFKNIERDRFDREKASIAQSMEGRPLNEQISVLDRYINKVRLRGGDLADTQDLKNLLLGSPEQNFQAQVLIRNARMEGENRGFIKRAPLEKKPTRIQEFEQIVQRRGFTPGTPEFAAELDKFLLRPQTKIDIAREEIKPFRVRRQKKLADRMDKISEAAASARESLGSIDTLSSLDVRTGRLEPLKVAIAGFGESLGIDTSKLANVAAGEAFSAEAGKTMFQVLSRLKGHASDKDMKAARDTVVNLAKTNLANDFLLASSKAVALRAIEKEDFFEDYVEENPDNPLGVTKAWSEYIRKTPFISKQIKTSKGLPMFFHEFETLAKRKFPDATREDIIFTWIQKNKEAAKKRKP